MARRNRVMIAAMLALAGCAKGQQAILPGNDDAAINFSRDASAGDGDVMADVPENGTAPLSTDAWSGKWIGVEGLVLNIQPAGERGRYVLSVTLLDGTKSYDGVADGNVIRFTRDGRPESIRAATGDETGLKWLAGKQNCLMIKQGEGFCREP
ncbi:hypothetical protein SAMN05444678_111101 [Sphingomonas sp. YR710]|uniref:hypothetical protein n=1 Tax=Sphingomonas sp. YR710 TaxID=1882773 RepID=UPI00088DF1B6|nr:hypothetical protein [Sphingomonas sp. YR710]SDD29092.1 hypothetical protein SAMN05444678_111101 [Sphingomonas sp. YR710]